MVFALVVYKRLIGILFGNLNSLLNKVLNRLLNKGLRLALCGLSKAVVEFEDQFLRGGIE